MKIPCLLLLLATALTASAQTVLTVPNTLKQTWPGELVSFDLPAASLPQSPSKAWQTVTQGRARPAQVEDLGKGQARLWTFLTIAKEDAAGAKIDDLSAVSVEVRDGAAPTPLSMKEEGEFLVIANGLYEFRLRHYRKGLAGPTPFRDVPHWTGGMRVAGGAWDGRAAFDGSSPVTKVECKLLRAGPVVIDAHITYTFADAGTGESTEALPLELGKQTHLWKPNQPPRETLPKLGCHYEVKLRFVMDDPWIEVGERFHLPGDESVASYGVHQYTLHWGKPTGEFAGGKNGLADSSFIPVDTATWVPWFEYDTFGGNVDQKWLPAEPRPMQKGRPFGLLRPRWSQGGGGSQDFILTSGGGAPYWDKATKKEVVPEGYDPERAAVGVIAAFPSKWVGPYPNTLAVYALDNARGYVRAPLRDGDPGRGGGLHYGNRHYGLCVGPRRLFTSLNSLVRRHSDWTLTALVNKYVLAWERDAEKARGPNVLISRADFAALRKDLASGESGPRLDILREAQAEMASLEARRDELKALPGLKDDADAKEELKKVEGKLDGKDFNVLRALTGTGAKMPKVPSVGLWMERRYQDDFLNPTSGALRKFNHDLPLVDLLRGDQAFGGAMEAAAAYIFTDLDAWPGWHHGWTPGNPNFHTDKYMPGVYIAAMLLDHPHAAEWLDFGKQNFLADMDKVLLAPDGAGYECPGYSGYSLNLQLDTARLFANLGAGNPVAENPLFFKTATWHRKLLTPVDPRLGFRHEAPHGDTHRWTAGLGGGFAKMATFFKDSEPAKASELMGVLKLIPTKGEGLLEQITTRDPSIPAKDPAAMDWSSDSVYGFGAMLRHRFGDPQESFLGLRAGKTTGHYHNDQMAFHYFANGTPISLDYNCSYHPRGDAAVLHNTVTFGREGQVRHNKRGEMVPAMEQVGGTAWMHAFATSPVADVTVAERNFQGLSLYPHLPEDHEFSRDYGGEYGRATDPITHRRLLALVKQPGGSPFADYLVVREEIQSKEAQHLNLHLLARDVKVDGNRIHAEGQWDMDMLVVLVQADAPRVDVRNWYYHDEWMMGPVEDYAVRPGESVEAWRSRMQALMAAHKVDHLPLPGWKPVWQDQKKNTAWFDRIRETDGLALSPPPFWTGTWMYGEYQKWLRIHTKPGSDLLWVLIPYKRGTPMPEVVATADGGVQVKLGGVEEVVKLDSQGGASVRRQGKEHEILPPGKLLPLGDVRDALPLVFGAKE